MSPRYEKKDIIYNPVFTHDSHILSACKQEACGLWTSRLEYVFLCLLLQPELKTRTHWAYWTVGEKKYPSPGRVGMIGWRLSTESQFVQRGDKGSAIAGNALVNRTRSFTCSMLIFAGYLVLGKMNNRLREKGEKKSKYTHIHTQINQAFCISTFELQFRKWQDC